RQRCRTAPDTYELELTYKLSGVYPVFHINILREGHEPSGSTLRDNAPAAPEPAIDNEGIEWCTVKRILDHRLRHKNTEFLVHWPGYDDPQQFTWEKLDKVKHNEAYEHWVTANGRLQAASGKRRATRNA
ncbi:hypothetical protein HDV00_012652, partial [Rhizophlyctis rosea]